KKLPYVIFTHYVISRGDAHIVTFGTDEKHYAELSELAERSMATLKARPVGKKTSAAYIVGRTAAQVLLAITIGVIAVALVRRRKRNKPIEAGELWPSRDRSPKTETETEPEPEPETETEPETTSNKKSDPP